MLVFEIRTLLLKCRIIVSNKEILNQIFKSIRVILCVCVGGGVGHYHFCSCMLKN